MKDAQGMFYHGQFGVKLCSTQIGLCFPPTPGSFLSRIPGSWNPPASPSPPTFGSATKSYPAPSTFFESCCLVATGEDSGNKLFTDGLMLVDEFVLPGTACSKPWRQKHLQNRPHLYATYSLQMAMISTHFLLLFMYCSFRR